MYSDTHLHFSMVQERLGISGGEILQEMASNGAFMLDVGTKEGDIVPRRAAVGRALTTISIDELREKATQRIYYSSGIWPSAEAIANRSNALVQLEKDIAEHPYIIAIGECGLDHHWNPNGEDHRSAQDFSDDVLQGEAELFEAQLEMARRLDLPVIVHSRDAFEGTLECIRHVGYDRGVIHCFSYGMDVAKMFLDRGWMIAFGGGVTYTKPSKMEAIKETIRSVPDDAILLETDAPFLAPEPMRGRPNSPLYIKHTYQFIADIRGVSVKSLCDTVDKNIVRLFRPQNYSIG